MEKNKTPTIPESKQGSDDSLTWWQTISLDQYYVAASYLNIKEWSEINDEICNPVNKEDGK